MRRLLTPAFVLALLWGGASSAGATCATTVPVSPGGLQTALNAVGVISGGDYCLDLASGTFTESPVVSSTTFGDTASRLVIQSTQALGSAVIVGSGAPGTLFSIGGASVVLQGLTIQSTSTIGFGIRISSPLVTLSSVTVADPSAQITGGGVLIQASRVSIVGSTVSVTGGGYGLYALSAPGLSVLQSYFYSASSGAVSLASSDAGTISQSQVYAGGSQPALRLQSSSTGTFTQGFVTGGAVIAGGASNTISLSTITSNTSALAAVHLTTASNNTLTSDYIANPSGDGLFMDYGANGNLISQTTMYSNVPATYAALRMFGASSNTITQSLITAPNGSATQVNYGASYNTFSLSTMTISLNTGGPFSASTNAIGNTVSQCYIQNLFSGSVGVWLSVAADYLTISQSTIAVTGPGSMGVMMDVSHSTVTRSAISAPGGFGIQTRWNGGLGDVLSNLTVQASTAVAVLGSTGTVIANDLLQGNGPGGSALILQQGAALTQIAGSTLTAGGGAPAIVEAAPGPLQATGPLVVRGPFVIASGAFDAGPFAHLFGGDLNWAGAQSLTLANSTITLDGLNDVPVLTNQRVTPPAGGASFGVLAVNVASATFFSNPFAAQALVDRVAASTIAFQWGVASPYNLQSFTALGGPGAGRISIGSTLSGTQSMLSVGVSSLSFVSVQDSSATATINANDGTSLDRGNNLNWNFLPYLVVLPAPQTWNEGVGPSGVPSATAGSENVTIRAVSAASNTVVAAGFPVTLTSDDPNEPAIAPVSLSAGVGSVTLQVRTARTDLLQATAASTSAFAGAAYKASVSVSPGPFTRLRLSLPGQTFAPGTAGGLSGAPNSEIAGVPFNVGVQSVDLWNNVVATGADQVSLTTATANLPQTETLVAGATNFSNVVFSTTGAARTLTVSDVTNGGIPSTTSLSFAVLAPTSSSPTVSIGIANNSIQTTLGGALAGTATDGSGVTQVRVALKRLSTGQFFTWSNQTFSSPGSSYTVAGLSPPNGVATSWSIPFADALLPGDTYYAIAIASNVIGAYSIAETTFVFRANGLAAGSTGDGQGSAVAIPGAGTQACQVQVATITFTAGPAGVQNTGAIALHIPDSWQQPTGEDVPNNPPLNGGFIHVVSTTSYALSFNPQTYAGATLGNNWIVFTPGANVSPGQPIQFVYKGFTGTGPSSIGTQVFSFLVQGAGAGNLKPLALQPSFNLLPGPATQLQFNPNLPLTVGPLQTSPTMQLLVTDNCGNSTNTATAQSISLMAGQFNQPDATALFYSSSGVLLGGSGAPLLIPGNRSASSGFYFVTNAPAGFENVIATGILGTFNAFANRFVTILGSSVSLTNVSIDTGTPSPGNKTATMSGTSFQGAAVVNFGMSNTNLNWEVIISTSQADFYPEVVHRFGFGDPGRTVTWNGVNERVYPNRYLPSGGPYYIKVRAAGGVAEDDSLQAFIAPTASIYGTLNSPGAYVQANGPNANYANFAVVSSTGYFQIFGLQSGVRYNVVATTGVVNQGQLMTLTTSTNNVTAAIGGTNVGALSFPTPSFLRVRVQIPSASPVEFWGGLNVHTQDFAQSFFGTLHYPQGADKSDDGSQSFGASASTWTVLGVVPGTYNLELNLPQVGISSTVQNVTITAGGTTDVAVSLPRKANLYGWAALPAQPQNGSYISVQALKAGDSRPSIYGGASIPSAGQGVAQTSATYGLYGLDPGSWTITARAFGFGSVSSNVYISSSADIGNPVTGGFDLFVSSGGALNGVIKLIGDSSQLAALNNSQSGVSLFINAYNPQTYSNGGTQVTLSTSSTFSSSTFSITGLDNGVYFVNAFLDGAAPVQLTTSVVAGAGYSTLNMQVNSSRVALTISLPGPSQPQSEYHNVSLFQSGQGGPQAIQDITTVGTLQYYASSATWLSPALGAGYYSYSAYYNRTGMFKALSVALTNNTTAAALVDLSGSTFSIQGSVLLSANVDMGQGANAVSVSSVAGVLANSAAGSYCLMGSIPAISTPAFHLELLPISSNGGGFLGGPLVNAQANCANPTIPTNVGGNSPNPLLAYVANISTTGAFSFPGVAPGTYLLRVPTSVDGFGNDNLPPVRQVLTVSSNTTGVTFSLGNGVTVSGNLLMPPGLSLTRPFNVSLLDSTGQTVKSVFANVNNANSVPYSFTHVPGGAFAIRVEDFGFPQIYGARPITFKSAGVDLPGQDIQLVRTGIIKGKIAVSQTLPNSTTQQFLVITQSNFNLLPRINLYARANPWFQGGQVNAQNSQCGGAAGGEGNCGGFSLDSNDQFVINNVLPGTYDVIYQSDNDPTSNSTLRVVSSLTPGVVVGEARTTDVGTVNLSGATQIQGTVYDAMTSSPIANVVMAAEPSVAGSTKHDTPQATTDAGGHYTLVGLDPAVKLYDIYANYRNGGNSGPIPNYGLRVSASVDVTSVSLVNFALAPAPYSVSGRVVGQPNGPALAQPFNTGSGDVNSPGAVVFLQKTTELPHDNPIADTVIPTDGQGNFSITALTTGTYKIVIASLKYTSFSQTISITTSSVNLGTITLGLGGSLSGQIRKPDGSNPSQHEVDFVGAVTSDFSQLLVATKTQDPNTKTVTGYFISGFKPGVSYQLIIGDDSNGFGTPPEARSIVFSTTTESRTLDVVLRPAPPIIIAKAQHVTGGYNVSFELSRPLREKTQNDDSLSTIVSTFSAQGSLSQIQLSSNRELLTVFYTPGVNESSFTLKFNGFSTLSNPDSIDPINPEFVYLSTFSFFSGVDGYIQNNVSNMSGGTLVVSGNNGRVGIPGGAFSVDASSTVQVTLQLAAETLAGAGTSGLRGATANLAALRRNGAAYPQGLLTALAASPSGVNPLSSFYDILLPLGVRASLQKPVQMTIAYSTGTDPTKLNLYWYNAAANAYVLQQDVTGASPIIDTVNHTITINVNHFSTFVLFNSNVAVITGAQFAGGDIEAYNFPNPFDLNTKTITAIHGTSGNFNGAVRGTMIRFALPSDVSGDASIRIFNVAGERVRTIDVGTVNGGSYFYQEWDGRNDSGRDVASGVYIGEVKVGSKTKFFKMALIK